MNTKPSTPIPASFPTCGEVFQFLIDALDLPAWGDIFDAGDLEKATTSDKHRAKRVSDQLRDWATEAGGRAPRRSEFVDFIHSHTACLPAGDEFAFVLAMLWTRVLDEHCDTVRTQATFLERDGTRGWYALLKAPGTLYFLYALQKMLLRLAPGGGPSLAAPLDELVKRFSPANSTKHPLLAMCFARYTEEWRSESSSLDPKSVTAWRHGAERPSFASIGRHFKGHECLTEIMLNFGFAALVENLATAAKNHFRGNELEMHDLLCRQARCLRRLDERLAEEKKVAGCYSLEDYGRYLGKCFDEYQGEIVWALEQGESALQDLRWAAFAVYPEYDQRFLRIEVPEDFQAFYPKFDALWKSTRLDKPTPPLADAMRALEDLRRDHPLACRPMAGPLLAIEARLALLGAHAITQESMQRVLNLYRDAVTESRYRAGAHTGRILREALGFGALLHRREVGEGAIKPWLKQVMVWWDLLGFGSDFNHEQEAQRFERAETKFTDALHPMLRQRLRKELPALGLMHWNLGGMVGFTERDVLDQLLAEPVDKRQKKPMNETIVGREQTALMEAIDRKQLDLARELVRKGADLNFINSTGDTVVTKAFAKRDYELVLEILRRCENPIRRTTLLRMTDKKRISALKQAISHGRVEILRELALWKSGRGDVIDMDVERINGVTPLYYAVNYLAFLRMDTAAFIRAAPEMMPSTKAMASFWSFLTKSADHLAILDGVRQHNAKDENPAGVLDCIDYLIQGLEVNLDAPNTQDHTALTVAVEARLHDVAFKLLAARASVNHRAYGGATALCFAIRNDDYDMVKRLLEYQADYLLFVNAIGRPIYAMEMSEKIRRLIPSRL